MSAIGSPRGSVEPAEGGGDGVRVVFRRDFADPVEDVWQAVTDPERLGRWMGTYTGDASEGATVQFVMTAEGQVEPEPVTIVVCDPPHHLVVDMPDATGPDRPPWRLEVHLDTVGGGTALTFVHHLSDPSASAEMGPGWQYYLDRLDASLGDGEMPEWEPYLELKEHYRAGPGHQGA
jgi:uncharacterized protein YndB with AHSA1/START domain